MPIDGGTPPSSDMFLVGARLRNLREEGQLHQQQRIAATRKNQEERAVSNLARTAFGPQEPQEEGALQLAGPDASGEGQVNNTGQLFQQYAQGRAVAQQSGTMADQLESLARLSAGQGYVNKAQEIAKTSSLLRQREAAADASSNSAALSQIRASQRESQLVGQIFGGVTDEPSWQRAIAVYEFRTGQQSEMRGMPYSPALVQRVQDEALSANERLNGKEKELTRQSQDRYRAARLGQIDTQNQLRADRLQVTKDREERLAKAGGGKAVTAPSADEQKQVERLVRADHEGIDSRDLKDAAYSIAAEARALRRANPALNANQALQQAYASAKQAGDFVTDQGILGSGIKAKTSFAGRGRTVDMPAPLPKGKDKLQPGRFYTNPSGQVGKWTGKGFQVFGAAGGGGGREEPDDAENDDDEDDDS